MGLGFCQFSMSNVFEKLLQLGPTFAFQVVLTRKKPRKTWLLNGYNIYQVGMCCFYQIRVCDNLFPRRCTRPSLQCQLPFVPLAFKLSKNKKTQKTRGRNLDHVLQYSVVLQMIQSILDFNHIYF